MQARFAPTVPISAADRAPIDPAGTGAIFASARTHVAPNDHATRRRRFMWRPSLLLLTLLLPPSASHVRTPRRGARRGGHRFGAGSAVGTSRFRHLTAAAPPGSSCGFRVGMRSWAASLASSAARGRSPPSRLGGDSIHFAIPHQWENGEGELTVDGRLTGDRLAGSMTFPDGKRFDWTGVHAPALRGDATPTWGAPIHLLHANDLAGWQAHRAARRISGW